jgi:menaquinone-dependent protoporphyrinogen oxidase
VITLIAFATTEGQARKVTEHIALYARERNHDVELYDTASLADVPMVDEFAKLIVVASVHEERHQESAINFVFAHLDQLRRKPSAFVSVSLSAAMADGQAEAQHYADRFMSTTGWSPAKTLLLAGALPLSKCDYFQRQVLKHILAKLGDDLDQDFYEFTNWADLDNFIDHFLRDA